MPKVAVIERCDFQCPHYHMRQCRPHCGEVGNDFTREEIKASISGGFPSWCPLPDSSEKITLPSDRYTIQELWQSLGQLDWMVKPRRFRDHCGPDKQKEHDCLMGAKMFLEYIKGKHKGNL